MTTIEGVAPDVTLPPRYQIRAMLKQTAETCVYRVFDVTDRRDKAIKILRHEIHDPQQFLRFKTEFNTLASLEHASVIKVYDFGILQDRYPFFTMEFFAGKRITDYFDGQNWDALYDVVLQIASGLHHIHRCGIVHLDLKPSNILVSDDGIAKIMDFGLAIESRQVFDRLIRGTLQYMAPEVLKQDRVDSRADLYALGMTLYETVTGALPGYGRPSIEVIRMHLDEEIRRPSSINPRVPDALDQIIMKMLEKDPRHRFPTAAALLQAVADAAGRKVPQSDLIGGLIGGRGELYAAPLIGRKAEVEQLGALIADARDGHGNGVILAGAEGMGKSRIIRDATLRAQLDGARVFCGRCPVNRKTIYAPFFEIFQQLVLAVNPEADVAEEIRRILRPVVASAGPDTAPPQTGQKYRLYNRIVQSMQDIYGFLTVGSETAGSPLILLIEDLQWADPSTAELFSFLVGEAKQNKLLVIGTLTLETGGEAAIESASPNLSFWEQNAREASFPIIRVDPLTEGLVREHLQSLLGAMTVTDEFSRWMFWESAGTPLNIRRIVDYLIAHEYLTWQPSGWTADMERIRTLRMPGGFGAILMERVETLAPSERGILEIASVYGESMELELLQRVSDLDAEATYASVRALDRDRLVDESNDGKTITFPQIHLRDAVYNAMPERRRIDLHLRIAEALEPASNDGSTQLTGQVAYHFARANDIERGTRYSIEAGDLATRTLAHEEATEFYRVALEMMDLGGMEEARKAEVRESLADAYYRRDDYRSAMHAYQFLLKSIQSRHPDDTANVDVARVMKKIGKVLARRGDMEAAMTYYHGALAIYERLDETVDVAETLNRMAYLHRIRDDLDNAFFYADRARAILEPMPPTVVYGYVKNMLGSIEFSRGNWQRSREIFEEAAAIGESLASEQLRKVASMNLGNTLWKLGDWEPALQHYRSILERCEEEGDLWDLATAYSNVGVVEYGRGNFHAAAELFEKSVRIDEKIGALEHEALAHENLGDALEMLGRWDQAAEQFRRSVGIEGFDETRPSRLSVYVPLARLTKKRGDIAKAMEYAQKALAAGERGRDEDLIAESEYVLASIEDERGNVEEAERHLDRAMKIFEANHTLHGLLRAHTAAAVLVLQKGDLEKAMEHADLGEMIARQLGDRFSLAKNDWARAKIHSARGEREAAAAKFESVRAVFEELDTPYELGRLLFDVGLLREEPEDATQMIRSAIRIFERLDATHDLERARGALFRIKPAGKAPDSGVVGLYEIVKIINSTLDLQEVLNRVLDVCVRRLRAERGMIILLDPLTGALRTRVVRNIRDGEQESKRSPQSIVKEVIQSGQPVMSADARADQRFTESESVIAENIVSILCAPLIIKERISGAIYIDHRQAKHLFSPKDLTFLEAFADQAAIAIENARLYEELEEARTRLSLENETLRREVLVEKHLDSIVGSSEAVAKIQFAIRKASSGFSTVLLRGESGTGKGLVARIIHNIGPRRNGPFIKFNCAALPETLAESELFGHEKGAFTGADRRKLGRFELANNGSIFLDEIGKMTLAMQAKLLRVVEDKEFERVGGTQTIKTDVKIIAATNLDLEKAIEENTFREDLFYRLNIIPIVLPPLRERKDDIPLLAEYFIRKICRDLGIDNKRLEPGVLDLFVRYDWPGNVRELEATLHRAIVMSNGDTVTKNEFYNLYSEPTTAAVPVSGPASMPSSILNPLVGKMEITSDIYDEVMSAVDKQLILRALESSGGRIREAARRLGLARNTLKSKIQKYNIAVRE
ncbi:MAG TPA: sigma 54-interacting transcriptional regulator [Thermoanaerobaculia bacterium]|jgi:Nif-specific regulatory protein|nr:sigma 54-interacting transcriptional regulator [Thermoanaerobaculia bacterium]